MKVAALLTPALVMPALVAAALTAAALGVRALALRHLDRLVRTRLSESARLLERALRLPSLLWCAVLGLYGGMEAATLPPRLAGRLELLLQALLVASVTLTAANLLAALVARFGERRTLAVGVTGLAQTVVKGAVLTVGALILLGGLGVAITPLLTALGIGGLAVALALQDSLSNLFAGIHLLADKPVRVGDFIRLESGIEGFVEDIGWRSTRIRLLPNNLVIVPNAKLAGSTITNYHLPEPGMSLLIPVGVSYDADPDRVEEVLVEEATKAAGEVPGLQADPAPFVRFIPGFGDYSLNFTLICRVASFVDQYLVQHELRKRILRRFRAEGIEIPFPIRTVELRSQNGPMGAVREETRS
ncbi:MAG: mechanosensitive ion channel family protein [Candidatus Rokubacteria bacterium]|nr:mechanosensitive ion channel family protein [Candidatus Rokubacteria bacterium]